MFYHVVRRPPNTANSIDSSRSGSLSPSSPTLMPRYHYSRTLPNSASNQSDSTSSSNYLDNKSNMTAMTMNNNHQTPMYASFKSTIIPLLGNNQTTTTNKRESVQIPITKEESTRSIPINVVHETNSIPPAGNHNNHANLNPRTTFTSKLLEKGKEVDQYDRISRLQGLLRPTAKYFQSQRDNSTEDSSVVPRLPSVSRRLSLTIPVATTVTPNVDDEVTKTSTTRQIPIRLSQPITSTATPLNNSRISSAIFRSSPVSNNLHRQKTDIGDSSSSTPALSSTSDSHLPTPLRRAEALAREAIQGLTRLHHHQQQQRPESNPNRFSALSRRVIINLKNNQSVSLDSQLSSALKPPPIPSSTSRHTQRNNLYHIPVLHEIQMPSHPATALAEDSTSNGNNHFKNEVRLEIPVSIDQENRLDFFPRERLPSSANHTLKSILKRSSSRETVSRKNVSFMNA